MRLEYKITKGNVYSLGISLVEDVIHVAVPIFCTKECGMILYIGNKEKRIPFSKEYALGNLYVLNISVTGVKLSGIRYKLFEDGHIFLDSYATIVEGREKWGIYHKDESRLKGRLLNDEYDWEGDRPLQIPFCDSVLYHAHVRGFTKHKSSGVAHKGTFLGAVEKIPHLKELGVTGVCFMPMYEFDEILKNPLYVDVDESVERFMEEEGKTWQYKLNYWGFSDACYFAPKASFCVTKAPRDECRDMIKAFHKEGLEVLMQIYFPKGLAQEFIYQVICFWVEEYHIDGFLLQGYNIPQEFLKNAPMLANTKLIFEGNMPSEQNDESKNEFAFKNQAYVNYDFMYQARQFLKGDGDMLYKMAQHFRANHKNSTVINQIASYNGFTLMDLVSYDRKHNELNGEDNRDGNDYNYSWNCGFEGATRKKQVLELRMKQYKNALCMVLFAQGTPMILAGDEFGNTHNGNNNAYCQDNVINWLNWNDKKKECEIFEFTKKMIAFSKEHPILHQENPLRIMDYISCGYPDLSYHGEMAWYADFANYNRHIGIMYCGKYARKERDVCDDFIYILYNMHWIEHDFALPKLPKGMKWYIVSDTAKKEKDKRLLTEKQLKVTLEPRSISILIGEKENKRGGCDDKKRD